MKTELGFAEKTIVKAYAELKSRGIIEAKKRKGYFVVDDRTKQAVRVMLLMYGFELYQKTFYNTFKIGVGENVRVDTFFHHGNLKVFKNFISENLGNYSMFVVAPVHHPEAVALLKLIPHQSLLIVDRHEFIGDKYAFITQDFETYTYKRLMELKDTIKTFSEIKLYHQNNQNYPKGTLKAFQKFVTEMKMPAQVEPFYKPGSIKSKTVYFTENDSDLWALLQDCEKEQFEVGADIGIIAQDDTPAKAIVCGGITSISTDFSLMAQKAAEFVLNRTFIHETIPAQLIRRKSL